MIFKKTKLKYKMNKTIGYIKKILVKLSNLRILDIRKLYVYWEHQKIREIFDYYRIDCVFDVGANVGQYATMLRKKVGYKGLIISFEPNPQAAQECRRKSNPDELWIVEECAISNMDGILKFNIMNDSEFSSIHEPSTSETEFFAHDNSVKKTLEVKSETIASAYQRIQQKFSFNRPFLKLDTQGHDFMILKNQEQAMKKFVALQTELCIKRLYTESVDFTAALNHYRANEFDINSFVPNNSGHFPDLYETDCILINKQYKES